MENSELNNSVIDQGFSLVTGGLIYKLMTTLLKTKDPVKNRRQRALLFAFIAWLPLVLEVDYLGLLARENFKNHIIYRCDEY